MRILRNHEMTKRTAMDAVKSLLPELMSSFGGSVSNSKIEWQNDTAKFSGRVLVANIKGTLHITDSELVLDVGGIPFFLRSKARSGIEEWFDLNWPGGE